LGYAITTLHDDAKRTKRKTNGTGQETKCRSVNRQIGLQVPQDVIKAKCERYKQGEEAIHRTELLARSDFEIVMTYQLEYRGIVNYYRLAYNVHRFRELKRVMETSLTKTMAHKYKVSVPTVYDGNRTELVQRLLADFCELCGSDKDVEVHHVRAMRKLHEYPGRPKPEWVKRMIAMRRKTLLLCKRCHEAVEHGLPITWTTLTLKEVKARRKARMTAMPEGCVH
jgi:Type II intron maturase